MLSGLRFPAVQAPQPCQVKGHEELAQEDQGERDDGEEFAHRCHRRAGNAAGCVAGVAAGSHGERQDGHRQTDGDEGGALHPNQDRGHQ